MTICFGTDGWRGVISDAFTLHEVLLVAHALPNAVASGEWLNGISNGPLPCLPQCGRWIRFPVLFQQVCRRGGARSGSQRPRRPT